MASERSNYMGALIAVFMLLLVIILAFYDYFTTPQFKILFFFGGIALFLFNMFLNIGEFLGIYIPAFAKKIFITRGGLIGIYQRHEQGHSGIMIYYITTYTRYLHHCNYFKFGEKNWIQRFTSMMSPTRMIRIADYANMFEEIPSQASDVQEGAIFYHGTLRGVQTVSFEETLKIRLQNSLKFISSLYTEMQSAKAAADAAASGQNQQIVNVSTQLSTALNNVTKFQKNQPILLNPQQMQQAREQ